MKQQPQSSFNAEGRSTPSRSADNSPRGPQNPAQGAPRRDEAEDLDIYFPASDEVRRDRQRRLAQGTGEGGYGRDHQGGPESEFPEVTPRRARARQTRPRRPSGPWARVRSVIFRPDLLPCHFGLLATTLLLTFLSVPFVYSSSMALAIDQNDRDIHFFLRKQLVFALIGITLMVLASRIPEKKLGRACWILYFVTIAGLIATKFTPLGVSMGNVERWVKIPGGTFQFSELAKFALIGIMADYWSQAMADPRYRHTWVPWLATAGLAGLPMLLVVIQPHLSATLILGAIPLAIAVYAGAPWRHLSALAGGAAVIGAVTIVLCCADAMPLMKKYQSDRIKAHFVGNGKKSDQAERYQQKQGQEAIERGGPLGVGPGASLYKNGHLPAPHTDFIFAVIAEEFGLLGSLCVIGLLAVMVFYCFQIGFSAKETSSALLCAGVGTLFAVQSLGNIAVVTGVMPVTGLPLPFITYGGSGLWCALLGVGLVLAVSRSQNPEAETREHAPMKARAAT